MGCKELAGLVQTVTFELPSDITVAQVIQKCALQNSLDFTACILAVEHKGVLKQVSHAHSAVVYCTLLLCTAL